MGGEQYVYKVFIYTVIHDKYPEHDDIYGAKVYIDDQYCGTVIPYEERKKLKDQSMQPNAIWSDGH